MSNRRPPGINLGSFKIGTLLLKEYKHFGREIIQRMSGKMPEMLSVRLDLLLMKDKSVEAFPTLNTRSQSHLAKEKLRLVMIYSQILKDKILQFNN
jgi:hypothetical protein